MWFTSDSLSSLISSLAVLLNMMEDWSSLLQSLISISITHFIILLMFQLSLKSEFNLQGHFGGHTEAVTVFLLFPSGVLCFFADVSKPLQGACMITKGDQVIDDGYPGALSRYTLDFALLYSFLPALLLLGMISFKIRDRLIRH